MSDQTSEQSNIVKFPELKFPPIEYGVTTAALAELTERYKDPDASTDDGYEHCKDGCRELTALRTAVETRRKDLKAPALNWGRDVDKQAKDITRRIKVIEDPVRAEKERIDEIKQAEARKAAEAEQARVDGIHDNIEKITATAREQNPNDTAADYQQHITWLTELAITDEMFGEFVAEACTARDAALFKLSQWHERALEREESDRKRKAEQAEIDQQKEDLEAREAKQREESARLEREKREAEDRKAAEEKTAQEKAEREQREKDEAEEERRGTILGLILLVKKLPETCEGLSAENLNVAITKIKENKKPDEPTFQEFLPDAEKAFHEAINALQVMLKNKRDAEETERRDEEARLPDRDKLLRWCDAIASIPKPEVLNDNAQKVLRRYGTELSKLCEELRSIIVKL